MWHFVNLLFYYLTCFKLFSFQKMTVFGILQSGSFILIMQSNCKICRFFRGYQSDRDFFQSIIFPKLWFFFQKKFYSETGTMYKTFSRVRGFLKDVAQFLTLWKTITSEIDMSKYSHFSTLQFLESENQKWTFSLGICHQNRMFKKTNKKQQSSTFWAKMNQNVIFSLHNSIRNLIFQKKRFEVWHVLKNLSHIPWWNFNYKTDFFSGKSPLESFISKCQQNAETVVLRGKKSKRDFHKAKIKLFETWLFEKKFHLQVRHIVKILIESPTGSNLLFRNWQVVNFLGQNLIEKEKRLSKRLFWKSKLVAKFVVSFL